MKDEIYLTAEQVAEFVQLSPKTIEREARKKNITGYKLARKWRFKKKDVEAWIIGALNKKAAE